MVFLTYLFLFIIASLLYGILYNIYYILLKRKFINFNESILPSNIKIGFLFSLIFLFNLINYSSNDIVNSLISFIITLPLYILGIYIDKIINKKIFYCKNNVEITLKNTQNSLIFIIFQIIIVAIMAIYSFIIHQYFLTYFLNAIESNLIIFAIIITFLTLIIIFDYTYGLLFKFNNKKLFRQNKMIINLNMLFVFLNNEKYFYKFNIKLDNDDIINFKNSKYYTYLSRQIDYYYFIKNDK